MRRNARRTVVSAVSTVALAVAGGGIVEGANLGAFISVVVGWVEDLRRRGFEVEVGRYGGETRKGRKRVICMQTRGTTHIFLFLLLFLL